MTERSLESAAVSRSFLFAGMLLVLVLSPATAQKTPPPAKGDVPPNPLHIAGPVQPVAYSHKVHLALGLECQSCHFNPDPGIAATFPATTICMTCHVSVARNKSSIQKLAGFAKAKMPVPWVRVYQLMPGITWSHRTHLQAGMTCETCHGPVQQLDVMAETTSVTAMGGCLACHVARNAKSMCVTCHPWPGLS